MSDPLTETPLQQRTTAAVVAKQVALRPDANALVGVDGTADDLPGRRSPLRRHRRRISPARGQAPREGAAVPGQPCRQHAGLVGYDGRAMVSVPINSTFKGETLADVINESQASVIAIEGGWIERLTAIADQLLLLQTVVVRGGDGETLSQRLTVAPNQLVEPT